MTKDFDLIGLGGAQAQVHLAVAQWFLCAAWLRITVPHLDKAGQGETKNAKEAKLSLCTVVLHFGTY